MIKWEVANKPGELREYKAHVNGIDFYIWHACDAGFGLTAYRKLPDGTNKDLIRQVGGGITWLRTLRRCKDHAEVLARNYQQEQVS